MATLRNSPGSDEPRSSGLDRAIAALFLVYFAPLMLAVAFLVKADSKGPVLEQHSRRRADGTLVTVWEFRTMAAERAKGGVAYLIANQYTSVGEFLHVSRLDLLPRLFSALRGEISFAGLLR